MTAGSKANTPIVIEIGGVTNPRSMSSTDDFVVTTLDTDGVSEIDSGYNKRARMTKVGEITSVLLVPTSDVNGMNNDYTFTMYSPIPITNNDQLKFTFPEQIVPPKNSEEMNCQGVTNINNVTCTIVGN